MTTLSGVAIKQHLFIQTIRNLLHRCIEKSTPPERAIRALRLKTFVGELRATEANWCWEYQQMTQVGLTGVAASLPTTVVHLRTRQCVTRPFLTYGSEPRELLCGGRRVALKQQQSGVWRVGQGAPPE